MNAKHLHLIISVCIILPTAIVYGLIPDGILKDVFHFNFQQTGLANIFRAIMGLYIGMVIFWIIGIRKAKYWRSATLSNVLFMSGLAFGRMLDFILNGRVSLIFVLALVAEIILAVWGIVNLKKYNL